MMFRFLALPVAAVLLAAGCTPGNGTPTPTPTPSLSSVASTTPTPTATPTPTPSEDPLFAEAKRVYMAAAEARWKYELTGDYSEFPPELGNYLDDNLLITTRDAFEEGKATGVHLVGGEPQIQLVQMPEAKKQDSSVAVLICYDTSALTVVDAAGAELRQGRLIALIAYFRVAADGQLKIFTQDPAEVGQCEEA